MRNVLTVLSVLCLSHGLFAQLSVKKYTQVLLDYQFTEAQALSITDVFFQNPAVETSRMDPTTNIFLCIYEESIDFNELSIITWLGNEGYNVKCYYTDEFGVENFIDLKDINCE